MTYSVLAYCDMIGDRVRSDAYVRALTQELREGDVVAEVGTGTGVFALLAARLGASHVYAIETEAAVAVGRELAAANGLADKVTFIRGSSAEVELPGQVDLLLADMRGVLPLFGDHLPVWFDARERFLKPGGRIIPRRDELCVALVDAERTYRELVEQWADNHYELDVAPIRTILVNTLHKPQPGGARVLGTPRVWADIDYATATSPDVEGVARWQVEEGGTAHGLQLWFDAELAAGIGFSNAPGGEPLVYGNQFAPFPEPLVLAVGDVVEVRLSAHLVTGEYVWRWDTRVLEGGDADRPGRSFEQSTFHGTLVEPGDLVRRGERFEPRLTVRGAIDRQVLLRMGEGWPLGAIARDLAETFPDTYRTWQAALVKVGEMSVRYAR